MENNQTQDINELIRWQKRTFYIKVLFYIILVLLLITVLIRSGSDPCTRCKLKVDSWGTDALDCRQIIERITDTFFNANFTKVNTNFSLDKISLT